MRTVADVTEFLHTYAPPRLAAEWDNVGLLVGDPRQPVDRLMTCLTITPESAGEAVDAGVRLIVTHHPLPFKALQRITSDSVSGNMLLRLIGAGTAIYSAHTAFDSAAEGINQMWAEALSLNRIGFLNEPADQSQLGSGRVGILQDPIGLDDLIQRTANTVGATDPRRVGKPDQQNSKVAFACGSGGSFLDAVRRKGCDAMITGEAPFHTCLEAESLGIGLGLLGHYWSERTGSLATRESLKRRQNQARIW